MHIDPYYNHTAALFPGQWLAPRPGTDSAMVLALAYVWITEDLYDRSYVDSRTVGFEKWKEHVMGEDDTIPKTPEWQEGEIGAPAKDVRALAREWGRKKTYLNSGGIIGFGGACRTATGTDWARGMVYLMAMQGLGKPGVNMGGLQQGTPVDTRFFFPGYTQAQPRHDHRWIDVKRCERGQYPLIDVAYRPTPCMHAANGAITLRDDGIVLIDPEKAKGQKHLVQSCPYGAIYWNEEKEVPQKCTMCAHLLDDDWKQPRCAQAFFRRKLRGSAVLRQSI